MQLNKQRKVHIYSSFDYILGEGHKILPWDFNDLAVFYRPIWR